MNRTTVAGGSAVLALFLLAGCGSSSAPAPDSPSISRTSAAGSVSTSEAETTAVYAARFCTALSPLVAFKQRTRRRTWPA